jgi:ketosteroid isomerase-like protein
VADTSKVTAETLRRLRDAINAHDLDAVMSFFTDDCVLELPRGPHPWGRRFQGRGRCDRGWRAASPASPDVHYGDDRHWVSGDRAARSGC